MIVKQKRIAFAVLQAVVGMAVAVNASAQSTPSEPTQKVEKIEITGSLIKRLADEAPVPVEVITRKDIARTGATTVNELLKSIPAIDVFDQGEISSNSPSGSGTSNLQLRGLAETNTLVLLNGRRLPVNALYDGSGAGAAVDLNMIPVSAIERIEILKDGGSAVYGADAVAGVVNVITRKDFRGIEAFAGGGTSSRSDATEFRAGGILGFGDLAKDRFNVLVALDYYKRDPILRKDREISRSVDFRRFGENDRRSVFSPFGNLLDDDFNFTGQTVRPCPPENLTGGICRYDFNASILTAYNGADRLGAMAIGTARIASNTDAFAQFFYGQSKDHFEAHPVPDFFITPQGQFYAGRFLQGGPRITDRDSKLSEITLGLKGNAGAVDWEFSGGVGESKVTNRDKNYYDEDKWYAALESGAIDGTSLSNDPALVESLKVSPVRAGKSQVTHVDAKASMELTQLRGGALAVAGGVSLWQEKLVDTPDALTQAGKVVGSIAQAAVNAKRDAYAAYIELSAPLVRGLETQLAVRYDKYKEYNATSPKVAFKYEIAKGAGVRASWGKSFRAPSLKQLFGSQEQGAGNIDDQALCDILGITGTCFVPFFQVNGSNPNLKPERGENYNIGLILEPTKNLVASVDFWNIKVKDGLASPTIGSAIRGGLFGRDNIGRLLVFTNLQNIGNSESQGLDIDLRSRIEGVAGGTITLRNSTTYYQRIRLDDFEYVATYANPRWRNTFRVDYERGAWSLGAQVRSVAGFWDVDEPAPFPSGTRKVGAHDELDINTSYSGFRNLKIDLGIKNALDRQPPFSAKNASDNRYSQMGFAELYNNRGRFFYGNLTYTFR